MTEDLTCQCAAMRRAVPRSASEGLVGTARDAVLAHAIEVARSLELWMRVFRCEVCGLHWAEGSESSGHMERSYVFALPDVVDPARWLREDAPKLLPPR